MSYFFDNNNRYQIIFPYTSDKIHVSKDINYGAFKCYQELKDRNIKTYIFMIHDIDGGTVYHFNIPKYKNLHDQQQNTVPDIINQNGIPILQQNQSINKSINQQIADIESKQNNQNNQYNQITQSNQNEIITRLNHVEYQLDVLKKYCTRVPKKEEGTCVIL